MRFYQKIVIENFIIEDILKESMQLITYLWSVYNNLSDRLQQNDSIKFLYHDKKI
ncbi:MAG: hypothetical protein H6Q70_1311 [Firmicutes bacterium]|nr:hypothetical protein [Bacillota bacterium]